MTQPDFQRDILPIPDSRFVGLTTYDAKDPEYEVPANYRRWRPPAGAPNILIALIDDAGFGSSSAFGGPCRTPTAERLAADGLKLNRFHTTALCSPTRQALLTGSKSSFGEYGLHHRDGHIRSGLYLGASEGQGTHRRNTETQWIRHGATG